VVPDCKVRWMILRGADDRLDMCCATSQCSNATMGGSCPVYKKIIQITTTIRPRVAHVTDRRTDGRTDGETDNIILPSFALSVTRVKQSVINQSINQPKCGFT